MERAVLPSSSHTDRARLRQLLCAAMRTGNITLSSGKTTDFYIDGRLVTLCQEGLALACEFAVEAIRGRCEAVGGPTSGADPLVAGIGLSAYQKGLPLRLFFVRKEAKGHGMKRRLEGPPLLAEDRVALVDDVATTGASLLTAARAVLEEVGRWPTLVWVMVDREEGAREALHKAGLEFRALFTRSELVTDDGQSDQESN